MKALTLLFCFLLWTLNCAAQTAMSDSQVQVQQGALQPHKQQDLLVFKGIPYASPPTGKLRWQPPQPPASWSGIREAKHFPDQCMQKYLYDDMRFRASGVSEDCLYLNIWTAKIKPKKPMPVLVYFHGGGFRAGDGSEPRYDGAAMARKGIVVVTVNYRLGIFGMLAHPDLSSQSAYAGSGNYMFLDQQAALDWVVKNIRAFGGNPKHIVIGGESAGAVSVSALMASPLSRNMLAGAIAQSGAILGPPLAALPLKQAHEIGKAAVDRLVQYLKLPQNKGIEALRNISAQALLDAQYELGLDNFAPTIDGLFFPQSPLAIYQQGTFARVPVLAGVNSQEGSYTWLLGDMEVNKHNFSEALRETFPGAESKVAGLYAGETEEQIKQALQDLASDRFISFGTWNWLDYVTQKSDSNTYYYLYDHIRPARKVSEGGTGEHTDRGAVHSAEIEYALGNLDVNPLYLWQETDHKVSAMMQAYFAQFIKNLNPNLLSLPSWPTFDSGKQLHIDGNGARSRSLKLEQKRYAFLRHYYKL